MKATSKVKWTNFWNSALAKMAKLGEQRHLAALRDGFVLLIPLLIAASVGVIFMTFVFGWWDTTSTSILGWIAWGIPGQVETVQGIVKFVEGSVAQQISSIGTFIFFTIWKGIFDFLAIFAILTIAYSLAKIKGTKDPFIASLVALGAFMILTYGNIDFFGTNGLLVAILTALATVELFTWFEKSERLQIKMPAGVPPAVGRSFSKLFPTIFTLLIFIGFQAPFFITTALTTGFGAGPWFSVAKAISTGIQAPFLNLSTNSTGSFAIGFTFIFFSALLWFFGLHGQNILGGVFTPIFVVGLIRNQEFIATGVGSPTFLADGTQDAFIYFGGTGVTLGLIVVALFLSKRKVEREIIKFGGPAGIFNINEPLLFGIPLILNFRYFIPYMMTQITLFVTTWLSIEVIRWVPPVFVKIPFTTPVLIGGFLATSSWQGIVLALMNFTISCLIWLPFVLMTNRSAKKKGEELVQIDYRGTLAHLKKIFHKKALKKQ